MRHTATSLLLAALAISACKSKGSPGPTEPGPTPAIALSISTGGATVVQGGTTPVSATLTRSGGFTGDVLLTVDGVPSGVTGSVSTPVTSGGTTSATITIAVAASTAPGTYSLTVRGTGSGVAAVSAPFTLTVTQAPDFSLAITPGSASVTQGLTSTSIAVTITRTNYTDPVALALGGTVPAGVTATFTTTSFTVTVGPATAPGVYNLSVTGTGTPGTKSTPFVLTVVAAGSFALAITPVGGVSVEQGTPNSSKTVTITRTNYTGSVTLTAENLPAGLTAEFDPNPTAANSSILTLTATGAVAPATYSITIRGTGPASLRAPGGLESLEATTTLAVTVTAPTGTFSLGLALSCGAITILQGAVDDSRVVTINRTSFAAPVGLAVDGLPAGLTAGFASSPTTGTTSRLTLTASAAVAPGSYNLTIRGTGPALLRAPGAPNAILASVPLTVTVAAGAAATPDVLDYDFATGLMGWAPGLSCPSQAQPDWGAVIVQEQMFVMNGRGPAGN
ncbi:MAG: hypothetical protein HOP28_01235, partial [Gemmatimonadales bacterium]|nr:hypothetical protein [Gemmatimonadales bacterium]